MKNLAHAIQQLSWRRKLIAGLLFIFVVVTWAAVCAILASYLPL
jgi:hypothetical protein